MALFLNDHGGFRAEMTPQEHFNALHRKPTATRVLPPTSEYTKLLQDQWNETFRPDGELFEGVIGNFQIIGNYKKEVMF